MTNAQRNAIPIRQDCPSCGPSGSVKLFVMRADSAWALCNCGLVFLQTIYNTPEHSADQADANDQTVHSRYAHRRRRRIAKSRRQILDVLNHTTPGPLLDIGCSFGYTLEAASNLGLDAVGVEVDQTAVKRCRQMGFSAENANMIKLPFDDERFQIVTMKHVLEHTTEPRAVLHEVHRVLRPGGGLFIAVPHLRYYKAICLPETYHYFRFTGDGKGDGHYVYYTPDSLRRMLENLGFTVVGINPQLIHRSAPVLQRLAQTVVSPARWLARQMRTNLHLRKEFWLVAVRIQSTTTAFE